MERRARFNIGEIVIHKRQGYRGVVIDIDPLFQASGEYNPRNHRREFAKRNPWYRILVDSSSQMTYVEETMITKDLSEKNIENPNIDRYLTEKNGQYNATTMRH